LQGYIDGELDRKKALDIAHHLESCAKCFNELESLKQYLSYMKGLEKVDAPEDFLKRVHRRIDKRPEERKLFRALFNPMRLKIPLELSAVAAMVIAVIFVLQVTRPMKRETPFVEKKTEIAEVLPSEEVKPEKISPEKTQQVKKTKHPENTVSKSDLQAKKIQPSEGSVADRTTVSSEKTPAPERKRKSKAGSAEDLREGGGPDGLRPVTELTVVMILPGEQEAEEKPLEESSTAAALEPSEYGKELNAASNAPLVTGEEIYRQEQADTVLDKEETVRVSKARERKPSGKQAQEGYAGETENPAFKKAAEQLISLVRYEGGRLVAKNFPETSDHPFVVTVDIPRAGFYDFLEQLGSYGELQIPPIGEAGKNALTIRIRIEIRLPVQ